VATQADVGLVVGSTSILVGTVAAVDPMAARDDRGERNRRRAVELSAAGFALAGLVVAHAAAVDAQQCAKEGPNR